MEQTTYLMHYGVKGMKWGVRKKLPPAAHRAARIKMSVYKGYSVASRYSQYKMSEIRNSAATTLGRNKVDTYINAGTELSRIQSTKEFEKGYAYYATYKKHDVNEYSGLFGKNLMSRANAAAKEAEKEAAKDPYNAEAQDKAKQLRDTANNMKIYQLKLTAAKKLKVPSEENAGRILTSLLKDKEFKDNLQKSLDDSASKMKRPTQQILFNEANRIMGKNPERMSKQEKISLYKAANLTLTNHNDYEVNMQNTFYKALKKNGYSALVDTNDQEYSSYHARRPMIVFDTSSTKLQSVSSMHPKKIEKLYKVYNTERLLREIPYNARKVPSSYSRYKLRDVNEYVNRRHDEYMSR